MLNKPRATPASAAESVHDFMALAGETGGKEFQGFMGMDVPSLVLKAVAGEMRTSYIAGLYVPASDAKKRHQVEVVLRSRDRGKLYGGTRILVH